MENQQKSFKKKVDELRSLAKECIKSERSTEAFLHLSHALRLDEDNMELLMERSKLCSGDACQYHFALEDAHRLIALKPESWVGHYRLGEIQLQTCNYEPALAAFQTAFRCQDSDKLACKEQMDKAKRELALDSRHHQQLPWVGAALGMVISSLIVVLDYLSHGTQSSIAHPILKVTICIGAAAAGYWGAVGYRAYTVSLRQEVLQSPVDLLQDFNLLGAKRQHLD